MTTCVDSDPESWGYCDVCAPPPPPSPSPTPPPTPPSPSPPPTPPVAQYVGSVSELITAIRNDSVDLVVVQAGTYFTSSMSEMCSGAAICINRTLTIKAEVPGAVVLDAMNKRRVFRVQPGGTAELIGLNITGGRTGPVRSVLDF